MPNSEQKAGIAERRHTSDSAASVSEVKEGIFASASWAIDYYSSLKHQRPPPCQLLLIDGRPRRMVHLQSKLSGSPQATKDLLTCQSADKRPHGVPSTGGLYPSAYHLWHPAHPSRRARVRSWTEALKGVPWVVMETVLSDRLGYYC